jgi:RNA polymerase sigma-70 factor (ECF subfamily)
VNADSEPITETPLEAAAFDFDAVFHRDYARMAKVIARIVSDPARAEELAAEVFWKLSRSLKAQGPNASGWLHRAAVRRGLDELRKRQRREKYERLFGVGRPPPTPEALHLESEAQRRVRAVLAKLKGIEAELLVLRSEDFTYDEIARVLDLNPASVGTLVRRAEEAFRKKYVRRYGQYE